MKYVKPDLEELELVLEGSFLAAATGDNPGLPINSDPDDGDEWD